VFKKLILSGIVFLLFATGFASADEKKQTVLSMMDAAVKHYQNVGREQAFKDFSVKGGDFYKGEFYIAAYSMAKHTNEFHAVNPKLVGKNLMKLKDTDGKLVLIELYKVANSASGKGWVDYKWPHPVTKKIAQKQTYVALAGEDLLMIGYYE